jgi:hypothetical protein
MQRSEAVSMAVVKSTVTMIEGAEGAARSRPTNRSTHQADRRAAGSGWRRAHIRCRVVQFRCRGAAVAGGPQLSSIR